VKEKLRAALDAALARLRPALSFVGAHRFWFECATVTLLGILAAFSFGYAALRRTSTLQARIADLERVESSFGRWRAELQPPTSQESLSWRESDRALRGLGGDAARPLSVARVVAQRAAEVGIAGLRIHLVDPDTVPGLAPVALGGWTVEGSGEALVVEFDGDVADVIGFLGALPPQAALASLDIAPKGPRLHTRAVLLTRRIAEAAG
jgi:hypothetical protein